MCSIRQREIIFEGEFRTLCGKRGIKQEVTPVDSPKYNGVAERALALISDTALVARIQAQVLYQGAPAYTSLAAEAVSWACNALNRTTTKANPGNKSPYEMWYGSPPLAGEVWSFLKPAIYRRKRANKSQPKAQDCYYVGPSVKHPRDCMQVLTTHRTILTTRNVTWQHVSPAPPAPHCRRGGVYSGGGSERRGRVNWKAEGGWQTWTASPTSK